MPSIRNINPLGDIDVPLLGRTVAANEVVEVTDEQAEKLLMQTGNYESATPLGDIDVPLLGRTVAKPKNS